MSFIAESGSITIKDSTATGNPVVFDTNERLFTHLKLPTIITGSVTVPTRTATRTGAGVNNYIDVDSDTALATVHDSATIVWGTFNSSTAGVHGLVNNGEYNVPGTYIHFMGPRRNLGSSLNNGLPSFAAYTFFVSGGTLYFKERCRLEADLTTTAPTSITLLTTTLTYRLFVGAFI